MKKKIGIILLVLFIISTNKVEANKGYLRNELNDYSYKIEDIKIFNKNKTQKIKNKIRETEDLKDNDKFYFINGYIGYSKGEDISDKNTDIIYEELIYVLENINLDLNLLKDLNIFISPNNLINKQGIGINGYYSACIEGACNNQVNKMIILSIENSTWFDWKDYIYRSKVRRTILHELGHVINREFIKKANSEKDFWEEIYQIYPTIQKRDQSKWNYSQKENFAEDIVVILGKDLRRKPYFYRWKNTSYLFKKDMYKLFDKYTKIKGDEL